MQLLAFLQDETLLGSGNWGKFGEYLFWNILEHLELVFLLVAMHIYLYIYICVCVYIFKNV